MKNTAKIRCTLICILLSFAVLIATCSCSQDPGNTSEPVSAPASTPATIGSRELSSAFTRLAKDNGEITDEFKTAMADFSFKFFKEVMADSETDKNKNQMFSPLSAALCLGMLTNGAGGETRAQLEELFGMDIETLNKCLYAYISSLYTAEDCRFASANSIWMHEELAVYDSFLQANADWYDAQVYSVPFDIETLKDINNWCKNNTDGMIEEMFEEIAPDTVMILLNALVFDAKWQEQYTDTSIHSGEFTCLDGTKKEVQFLHSAEDIYIELAGAKGFTKNYSGGKYSLVCLLPEEGTNVYDFIASLSGDSWMSAWQNRQYGSVTVIMPEFECDGDMTLNDPLSRLGVTNMFSKADFSKLSHEALFCSQVKQKTYIKVDRNGTKAAAVTGEVLEKCADIIEAVILDRPFMYAIVDNATGLPLFVGATTAP